MSGHNRWSTIKHRKAIADAKKSKGWTKLLKEITVAARFGGGDPEGNPRLRTAMDKGRDANIPNDTIDRAIKKGTGALGAEQLEELVYQAYAPGGVALIIEIATDNRNRTAPELRKLLEKANAKLDTSGSVLRKFKKRGQLIFDAAETSEDVITEVALEGGAEDVRTEGDIIVVLCEPSSFHELLEQFKQRKIVPLESEVAMIPDVSMEIPAADLEPLRKLVTSLEEHDDVLNVYTDVDLATS